MLMRVEVQHHHLAFNRTFEVLYHPRALGRCWGAEEHAVEMYVFSVLE